MGGRGGGGAGAHLKKKEAAADEGGEEEEALGGGSPGWLEVLSLQGVRVVVVAVVVLRATAVTALAAASEDEPSLSPAPVGPCSHGDAAVRPCKQPHSLESETTLRTLDTPRTSCTMKWFIIVYCCVLFIDDLCPGCCTLNGNKGFQFNLFYLSKVASFTCKGGSLVSLRLPPLHYSRHHRQRS